MTNAEIREFKGFVKDTLVREYNMNEVEALFKIPTYQKHCGGIRIMLSMIQ